MNVPYQAAEKGLIAPTLPGRANTLPCPTCVLGRLDSSRTNPYAAASTLLWSWPGKNASWRGWGGGVRSPAFLSRLNSTPMDFTFISDRAPPFYTNDSMQRPAFVGPQVTGGGVLG